MPKAKRYWMTEQGDKLQSSTWQHVVLATDYDALVNAAQISIRECGCYDAHTLRTRCPVCEQFLAIIGGKESGV